MKRTQTTTRKRRRTMRETELLLARAMARDEFAEFLERDVAEIEGWARELDVNLEPPARPGSSAAEPKAESGKPADCPALAPSPSPSSAAIRYAQEATAAAHAASDEAWATYVRELLRGEIILPAGPQSLAELVTREGPVPLTAAERIGSRVILALAAGSIDRARATLDEGWGAHAAAGDLPTGAALLDVHLAAVLGGDARLDEESDDVKTLNALEGAGVETIGDYLLLGEELIAAKAIPNVGSKTAARLGVLARAWRSRAGLDRFAVASSGSCPPTPVLGHQHSAVPAVANDDPDMRRFCEEQTVRLLPFIERIAWSLKVPLPIEDLIQEGAKACFEALPRYDPNRHTGPGGKPLKVETFVAQRIRGGMLDFVRRHGRLLHGGTRTGRSEQIASLDQVLYADGDKPVRVEETLADESAESPRERIDRMRRWNEITKGLNRQERILVLEYFVRGVTLREIGKSLAISESRCSQMLSAILKRLREIDEASGGRIREELVG